MNWQSIELGFAGDHPTAAGHFPSNPIIPGALLLDEVVATVAGSSGMNRKIVIRVAKFFRPVRPGERLRVRWQSLTDGTIKFECRLIGDDDMAATGMLEISPVSQ